MASTSAWITSTGFLFSDARGRLIWPGKLSPVLDLRLAAFPTVESLRGKNPPVCR
tara:strand:- start:1452 stop:1616 length:165 start_codon:yes stop_codon:yes gene_type:complete